MSEYKFYAFFTSLKQGKTGLTVTVDVYDSAGNLEVNNAGASVIGGGLYHYNYVSIIPDDYMAIFKTVDATVDAQHIPALATKQMIDYIDARISEVSANVWNENISAFVAPGLAGTILLNTCSNGSGSVNWDYYVTEPDLVTPIADVTVRVTTDLGGTNTVALGVTDAFGKVTFNLDPGTYYLWSYKVYVTFSNPDTEVIP